MGECWMRKVRVNRIQHNRDRNDSLLCTWHSMNFVQEKWSRWFAKCERVYRCNSIRLLHGLVTKLLYYSFASFGLAVGLILGLFDIKE